MDRYLHALLTPSGRLTRAAFLSLAIPLGLLLTIVHMKLRGNAGAGVYGPGYAVLLALTWSQFCLMSRRLQDADRPGLLLVPVYLLATAGSLIALDPSLVADPGDSSGGLALALTLKGVGDTVLGLAFLVLLKLASSDGPNRFGPPFAAPLQPMIEAGEPDWVANATRNLESVRNAATLAADKMSTPAAAPPLRRTPRQGFGRR
jgi:uncharacterized membrane protein YhaH (DUF805 family)